MDETKEVLKNEIQPHLIGLRNEVKEGNNILKTIQDKINKISTWKKEILKKQ